MNGVDYSKNAAKEREYLKDTVSKVNKASEKRIADLDERHETAESKLRENHIRDRADLEKSYQKNMDGLKEKTASVLENKGNGYNEGLEKQRAEFENDSITKRKDFDQRLNDIKSSYKKSFESERNTHNDLQSVQKERYQKNVGDLSEKHDSQINNYADRMKDAGAGLKDQYNRERQQLVRAQEGQVTDIYQSERKKQNDLTHRVRQDMEKTKVAHEADQAHSKNYTENKLSKMEETHNQQRLAMAGDYSQKNKELAENQNEQEIKTNRAHQDKLKETTQEFNKRLREMDNDVRRRDNDSGAFKEVVKKQHGLNDQSRQENKIRQLSSQVAGVKNKYQLQANEDQEKYRDSMRAQSAEFAAGMDRKENAINAEKLITVTHEREKAQKAIEGRAKQNLTEKMDFDQNLAMEKKLSKEKLNSLKQHFHSSMTSLEEKLNLSMEDLNKVNSQDKASFVKKTNEAHIKDMFALRRDLSKTMDATVEGYETRIGYLQRENEKLKLTMDTKISDMVAYTDNKLDTQRRIFDERREAELNGFKLATDEREGSRKAETNTIIVNFQKKIDKMQTESESRIKLLTNEYENKLKTLTAVNSKEMAQKDSLHKLERDNLKKTFEEQKANLVATFEQHSESLNAAHDEKMNQMKNYNKLS